MFKSQKPNDVEMVLPVLSFKVDYKDASLHTMAKYASVCTYIIYISIHDKSCFRDLTSLASLVFPETASRNFNGFFSFSLLFLSFLSNFSNVTSCQWSPKIDPQRSHSNSGLQMKKTIFFKWDLTEGV